MKKTKGHWPKGKARNVLPITDGELKLLLRRVRKVIPEQAGSGDEISVRSLARDLDVSDRTVRRWLSGINRPSKFSLGLLKLWLEAHDIKNRHQ